MLPAWSAYLVALVGWPDVRWIDRDALRLAMNVEYASVLAFPFLAGLALDPRPPRMLRLVLFGALAAAVTAGIGSVLGSRAPGLFWMSGGVTYVGWLIGPPGESRVQTVFPRALLTIGAMVPVIFLAIVVSALTGAEGTLLLGFLYFAALHALDATGTFARFERWLSGGRGTRRTSSART